MHCWHHRRVSGVWVLRRVSTRGIAVGIGLGSSRRRRGFSGILWVRTGTTTSTTSLAVTPACVWTSIRQRIRSSCVARSDWVGEDSSGCSVTVVKIRKPMQSFVVCESRVVSKNLLDNDEQGYHECDGSLICSITLSIIFTYNSISRFGDDVMFLANWSVLIGS